MVQSSLDVSKTRKLTKILSSYHSEEGLFLRQDDEMTLKQNVGWADSLTVYFDNILKFP